MLDQLVGLSMLGVATVVFTYYSTWVFILPFVNDSNIINQFFLPRQYAIIIPLLLLLIGGVGVASFIANVMIKEAQKKKLKSKKD
ncbi:putative dolichol phosphate-mannose biosynthesis regulatory protein [[Candida] jaroonii]|uniref:Dolichol phosphate-mannose biosynthesis regulatory protein n=1 Tax=[Candida] jaroonii TaxID=467808 RepID=A0ACA9Y436_9ASCO|nr:putative dolichol phosphate-mannose biosynthesis regulatory protein [[Candida] jaroonii]